MLRLQSFAEGLFLNCNAIGNPRAGTWNDAWTQDPLQLHAESLHCHCLIGVLGNGYTKQTCWVYYSAMDFIMCQEQVLKTLI